MQTTRMTMAQALVRFLARQRVERDGVPNPLFAGMWGIFGHGNVTGLGQALEEVAELPFYRPQNEQAMVHASIAYAKMKNRLQTFACTSSVGPGATNMLTGAATATVNRLPVLLLPGDTFAGRAPHPVLQQLEYPIAGDVSVNDAFRPVSRFWDRIVRPEQLIGSLPEAMRVLTDQAETGAVTICLPEDTQTEAYDYPVALFEERTHVVDRPLPAEAAIARAVELIRTAERPLIVAGGGTIYSEASTALSSIAETCGIPVCETQAGKGVLPWDHPWNTGPVGSNGGLAANRLAGRADLVLLVGTRFADFTTASRTAFQHPDVRFVAVNVSAADAHKAGATALVGDARATLEALAERLGAAGYRTGDDYAAEVAQLKGEWVAAVDGLRAVADPDALTQANVIGVVNESTGPRDVVVCAAGGLPGDLLKLWRPVDPKGYHLEYGYSCMGYEIAGGLGVKMAAPDREVLVMVGDGSYLMLHTEIVTSIQEGRKLTIVLLDNGGYGCIRGLQMANGTPSFGNELRARDEHGRLDGPVVPVDFVRNAESLGALALRAANETELREALIQAKTADRTTLISVAVPFDPAVPGFESWWDVPVAEVSTQPDVQAARAEYVERRKKQRVFIIASHDLIAATDTAVGAALGGPPQADVQLVREHHHDRRGGRPWPPVIRCPSRSMRPTNPGEQRMPADLTFGVVGLGRMGLLHATNLRGAIAGARLKAAAVDPDHHHQLEADGAAPCPLVDLAALIADPEIDAIAVVSPTGLHREHIERCAAAGKAVFAEKPLAGTMADTLAVAETVRAAGIPFQIGFQRRFDPSYARARDLIAEGAIGAVEMFRGMSCDAIPPLSYLATSGGIFKDLAVHDIDAARFLTGLEIAAVHATGSVLIEPGLAEYDDVDHAVVTLRLANGGLGVIQCTWRAPWGYDIRAEVHGSRGKVVAELDAREPAALYVESSFSFRRHTQFVERFAEAYHLELQGFVDALRAGRLPSPGIEDGVRAFAVAEAATLSRREGRWVEVG